MNCVSYSIILLDTCVRTPTSQKVRPQQSSIRVDHGSRTSSWTPIDCASAIVDDPGVAAHSTQQAHNAIHVRTLVNASETHRSFLAALDCHPMFCRRGQWPERIPRQELGQSIFEFWSELLYLPGLSRWPYFEYTHSNSLQKTSRRLPCSPYMEDSPEVLAGWVSTNHRNCICLCFRSPQQARTISVSLHRFPDTVRTRV